MSNRNQDRRNLILFLEQFNQNPVDAENEVINLTNELVLDDSILKIILTYRLKQTNPWDDKYTKIINNIMSNGVPASTLLKIQANLENKEKEENTDQRKGSMLLYLANTPESDHQVFAKYVKELETVNPYGFLIQFIQVINQNFISQQTPPVDIDRLANFFKELELNQRGYDYLLFYTFKGWIKNADQILSKIPDPSKRILNTIDLLEIIEEGKLSEKELKEYAELGIYEFIVLKTLKIKNDLQSIQIIADNLKDPEKETLAFLNLEEELIKNKNKNALSIMLRSNTTGSEYLSGNNNHLSLAFLIYENMYQTSGWDPELHKNLNPADYDYYYGILTQLLTAKEFADVNFVVKRHNKIGFNFEDQSILSYFIERKHSDFVKLLLARDDIDINNPDYQPIKNAIKNRDKELVIELLERGATIPPELLESEYKFLSKVIKNKNDMITDQHFLSLQPYLYEDFLNRIPKMIFIEDNYKQTPKENPTTQLTDTSSQVTDNADVKVVYNNDGYISDPTKDVPGMSLVKGKALDLNGTPIGYTVMLPIGEVKRTMVVIYGGYNKKEKDLKAYRPPPKKPTGLGVQGGIWKNESAIIMLNLPDLLELDVPQSQMSEALHIKIQACIDHVYRTITNSPESLEESLRDLKNLPVFLFGSSFGGLLAINHAAMYPHTFNGYVSHEGSLVPDRSNYATDSNIPRLNVKSHLDPSRLSVLNAILDPILLMQNMDDNKVIAKVVFRFYKEFCRQNQAHNVTLSLTKTGSKTPPDDKDIPNKGHFFTTNPKYIKHYLDTMLHFMEEGQPKLPALSKLRAYIGNKQANIHFRNASIQQLFIGEALELAKRNKHTIHNIDTKSNWDSDYKPLFYALEYPKRLVSNRFELKSEILRLNNILTNDHIAKMLAFQSEIFFQYINEVSTVNQITDTSETRNSFVNNSDVFKAVKSKLELLDEIEPNQAIYFLRTLYKSNPDLLQDLHETFQNDPALCKEVGEAKEKFKASLQKKYTLTSDLWKEALRETQEPTQQNNPAPKKT